MPLQLRLPGSPSSVRQQIARSVAGVPFDAAAPVNVRFAPTLTAWRGTLLSGGATGVPVHAGSFLRRREIVLETELVLRPGLLQFILLHELFHFAWMRGGNTVRRDYSQLLTREAERGARGEMGESSGVAKQRWRRDPASEARWKHYVCESFCDTGAALWAHTGVATLAKRWRQTRHEWFEAAMPADGWRC